VVDGVGEALRDDLVELGEDTFCCLAVLEQKELLRDRKLSPGFRLQTAEDALAGFEDLVDALGAVGRHPVQRDGDSGSRRE
jgi:hypothetical protein